MYIALRTSPEMSGYTEYDFKVVNIWQNNIYDQCKLAKFFRVSCNKRGDRNCSHVNNIIYHMCYWGGNK